MCLFVFSVGRKNEVFIYQWYIPSASLEVGPWRLAATVQICVSLCEIISLSQVFCFKEKVWQVLKFCNSLICLVIPD